MRILAALLLLALPASAQNHLILLADDLGVDRIGAYAEHPDPGRTPNVDALARRGVLFRNAWAAPTCSPTRAALLTGRHGFRTGIGTKVQPGSGFGLRLEETTLPELLGSGWRSYALGKWHLGSELQGPHHPGRSGFGLYAGHRFNFQSQGDGYFDWTKTVQGATGRSTTYATTDTVNDAIRIVTSAREPWLLYVAFHAPHPPVHHPPAHLHDYTLPLAIDPPLYTKAMIEALDTEIGRLLDHVDERDTTVVFLGDNGTTRAATTAPFVPAHAKKTLFEGGINVPLVVAGAGVEQAGECAGLVAVTDIFATIAELAGVPSAAEDSVSLGPYLRDPAHPSLRATVYTELFAPNGFGHREEHGRAIRDRRYKLIVDERTGGELFFDLEADPFEGDDLLRGPLTPDERARYHRLRRRLAEIAAS